MRVFRKTSGSTATTAFPVNLTSDQLHKDQNRAKRQGPFHETPAPYLDQPAFASSASPRLPFKSDFDACIHALLHVWWSKMASDIFADG